MYQENQWWVMMAADQGLHLYNRGGNMRLFRSHIRGSAQVVGKCMAGTVLHGLGFSVPCMTVVTSSLFLWPLLAAGRAAVLAAGRRGWGPDSGRGEFGGEFPLPVRHRAWMRAEGVSRAWQSLTLLFVFQGAPLYLAEWYNITKNFSEDR